MCVCYRADIGKAGKFCVNILLYNELYFTSKTCHMSVDGVAISGARHQPATPYGRESLHLPWRALPCMNELNQYYAPCLAETEYSKK